MKRYYYLFLLLLCSTFTCLAQQDTTKNKKKDSVIYGPNTARYFYEEDVFLNRSKLYKTLDTTITNLHRYSYLQRHQNLYQDAGNMGTAMRSIYYQAPEQIGTNLGYNGYDLYVINPKTMRYYNAMSPTTDLYVGQGGNFRSIITVRFARNITPLWNVGIFYHRVGANRIYGKASQRNDPQTLLNNYGLHTNYFSKNQRYKLLANFSYYDHTITETGGYQIKSSNIDSLLSIEDGGLKFNLEKATATQNRLQLHVYQQIGVFDTVKFQVFHSFDYAKQTNTYIDQNFDYKDYLVSLTKAENLRPQNNVFYYAKFMPNGEFKSFNPQNLSDTEIPYSTDYTLSEHKVGLKGRIKKFIYVSYAQLRMHSFSQKAVKRANTLTNRDTSITRTIPDEYFVGGNLRYEFNDSMRIDARLDYLIGGDYRIRAVFQRGLWQAGYERLSYRPTLMQRQLYNVLIQWNRDFVNTEADKIFGSMDIKLPFVSLNPYLSVTNLKDLVYYDEKAIAQQKSGSSTQLLQVGLNTTAKWRKWNFLGNFIYTKSAGTDIFRVPTWFVNAQLFYENHLFKSALFAQFGVDVHWKSAYYANSYMPVTQEYFLQNQYLVENYVNTDLFMNFRIKRVLLFVKVNNVLQNLGSGAGYYNTPVYIGQARGVELGVNWLFFD